MISSVTNTSSYTSQSAAPASPGKPGQLPSPPSTPAPGTPEEIRQLALLKKVVENPVAVAAVSDNAQVDKLATDLYIAQQKRQSLDTYSRSYDRATSGADNGSAGETNGDRNPVAIAAVSDNPDVDELATTVYQSRQAQKMVDTYTQVYDNATEANSNLDENA